MNNYKFSCDECGWHNAPNMMAVAHIGFKWYCSRCLDKFLKEEKRKQKEKQQRLAEQQLNISGSKPV